MTCCVTVRSIGSFVPYFAANLKHCVAAAWVIKLDCRIDTKRNLSQNILSVHF
jgi:hypothetical protein